MAAICGDAGLAFNAAPRQLIAMFIVLLGSNDSDSRSCILLFTERTTFGRSSIGSRPYLLQNRYQNLEIPYIMQYKSHFQSDKPTTIEEKLQQGEHPYVCSPIMQAVKLTSTSQNIHNTPIVKDKRGFRAQHTEQLLPEETEPSVQQQVCHHVSHLILCVADLYVAGPQFDPKSQIKM
jgi:hypothetical protein